jgi:hypothetical protein
MPCSMRRSLGGKDSQVLRSMFKIGDKAGIDNAKIISRVGCAHLSVHAEACPEVAKGIEA